MFQDFKVILDLQTFDFSGIAVVGLSFLGVLQEIQVQSCRLLFILDTVSRIWLHSWWTNVGIFRIPVLFDDSLPFIVGQNNVEIFSMRNKKKQK